MKHLTITLFLAAGLFLMRGGVLAQETTTISNTISFQGFISDELNQTDNSIEVIFSMFDSQFGEQSFWKEQHVIVPVKGVFGVQLGSKVALPSQLPNQVWVGLSRNGNEFARIKVSNVPFALKANRANIADSLQGGVVSSINGMNGPVNFVGTNGLEITNSNNGTINIGLAESKKGESTLNQGTEWLLAGNNNANIQSWLGTTNQIPLIIKTGNIERMRISGNNGLGFVGINDNNPNYSLSIGGDLAIKAIGRPPQILIETPGRTYNTVFATVNQNSNIIYRLPAAQGTKHSVLSNDGSGNLRWSNENWSQFGNNISSNNSAFIGTTSNNALRFRTGNNERMVITEFGLVGINTGFNAPQQELDVYGSVSIRPSSASNDLGKLIIMGNNAKFSSLRSSQNVNLEYILPATAPNSGDALVSSATGQMSWQNMYSSPGPIGSVTPNSGAFTDLSASGNLLVWDNNKTHYTAIKGGDGNAQIANLNFVLPTNAGSPNNTLITDGFGNLSWSSSLSTSNMTTSGDLAVGGNSDLGNDPNDITSIRGKLRVYDTDLSNFTEIKGPAGNSQIIDLDWILPTNAGASNNMLITDGAGNLSWSSSVNASNVTASGNLSVGGNTSLGNANSDITALRGKFRVYDSDASHYTDIVGPNGSSQIVNLDWILPTNAGASNNMLITDGSGNLSWSSSVNASNITASGDLSVGGNTSLGNANSDITALKGKFRVYDSDASNYTDIVGPNGTSQTVNLNLILPTNAGANNNMLVTNGSGNLSWSSSVNATNVTASGFLSVEGNAVLGNSNTDQTSIMGSLLVWDDNGSHYTEIKGGDGNAQTVNLNMILPTNAGSSGQVLSTNGSGTLSWVTATPNWASPGTIGSTTPNTGAFTALSASNNFDVKPTGTLAGNTGEIRWYELLANGTDYTAFKAADAMANPVTYTLPPADGTSGQVLSTSGTGTLAWVTATPNWASPGTIGSTTPNTGAFTALSASNNFDVKPTGTSAGNTGLIRWYELAANGTDFTAFKAADAMAAPVTYTLPAADGSNGQVLSTNGSGILSWSSSSTNWASPGTIGSSTPNTGSFTTLSASNNISVNPIGSSAGNTGEIRWYELAANGTDFTAFKAADAMANPVTYTLPAGDGSAGQFLKTDGSGNLSWAPGSSGNDASSLQSVPISTTAPLNGQSLMYNSGTGKWEPKVATSAIQKFVLSEGTAIDIDLLDAADVNNELIHNLAISDHAFFRMINSSAITTITGFANGENGRIIYLLNTSGTAVKLQNQSTDSLEPNRLSLGSSNLLSLGANQTATLIWSATVNRWVLLSTN